MHDRELMRYIPPDALPLVWGNVREGLLKIMPHTTDDWIPEDVYGALKDGTASLFIHGKDDTFYGFLIVQVLNMWHGKRLHVWAGYSNWQKPMLRVLLRSMKAIAIEAGAKRITFDSLRPEWQSVCKRGGFLPTQTTYELNLGGNNGKL